LQRANTRIGSWLAVAGLVVVLSACSAADKPHSETLSQKLAHAADQAWTELSAKYPDAKRPAAKLVKLTSPDSWPDAMVGCMHDAGFADVTVGDDQSIQSGSIPTAQSQDYDVAMYACGVMFPLDPKYSEPLTNRQVDLLYRYYKDSLAPCLEKQGYTISAAPSLQVFEQSYQSGPWLPYAQVADSVTPEQLTALKKICPELPPDLWG
jgi:hypothetical protein